MLPNSTSVLPTSAEPVTALKALIQRQILHDSRRATTPAVVRALTCLNRHIFDLDLTVASIRHKEGIRNNSFALVFAEEIGMSPSAYLRDKRMRAASLLLLRTKMTITAIARAVGYEHLNTFGRAFKRWDGATPSEYRRHLKTLPELTTRAVPVLDGVQPDELSHPNVRLLFQSLQLALARCHSAAPPEESSDE